MPGYGSDQGFNDWLVANGHVMPEGAQEVGVLRLRAATYLDAAYGSRFVGAPLAGASQERAWPRTVHGGVVPAAVVEACYQAAWFEANNPGGLVKAGAAAASVKREKVDAIEVEYVVPQGPFATALTPLISIVDGLLAPYLVKCTAGMWVV
ncbi:MULTISPECIES: DnaT-like ssDNA-binding protein [Asticcacaulis]|uniref:DnaT-like ssDNA-binding protein n=1 Tax=Asticcacaulis TaxID=76890 RepID=UPI001AE41EB3|nr:MULTISPECIES: DnaT-like ssDNA-binding protein [Asticcacaulis]MBP2160275.1 hypothetical protein [Asticcacaulis solisilvae]MDR6801422.1 hypothetical protein [Asticcacaulis sp. BE141]